MCVYVCVRAGERPAGGAGVSDTAHGGEGGGSTGDRDETEKLISSMLQSFSKHKIKEALIKVVVGIENREVEVGSVRQADGER